MSKEILNLEPKAIWKNFYSLTQIPRPSGHEAACIAFMKKFGEDLGLETVVDPVGNVIIRKPATPGMENRKGVVLQGHLDMVPQKTVTKYTILKKILLKLLLMANGLERMVLLWVLIMEWELLQLWPSLKQKISNTVWLKHYSQLMKKPV